MMAQEEEQIESLVEKMLSHLRSDVKDYEPNSRVASFYANRSVFITGATGFIGKALVEKLLRSCRDIGKVYLLIREKRDKDVGERLGELLQSQIFDRIKSEPGGQRRLREKVRPIRGDITMERLGVSDEDMRELAKEVSLVFNSAATIRFSEPIDVAVTNNISSIRNLMDFCDSLENLRAIVHLSTAYSNCHKRDTIHEIFYEPPMRGAQIIEAVDQLKRIQSQMSVYEGAKGLAADKQPFYRRARRSEFSENDNNNSASNEAQNFAADLLDEFAEIGLRRSNRPNTYCFTKAISENFLLELCKGKPDRYLGPTGIPVCVLRPSIVGGAWREPAVGFVDNFNGATGAMMSLYTGALQAMPGDGERVADVVPIDMVASVVCCAGWFLVEGAAHAPTDQQLPKADEGIYIFNFVSGYQNPLLWRQVTETIARLSWQFPSEKLLRLPSSYFVASGWLYDLYDLINHNLVAWLIDFVRANVLMRQIDRRSSAVHSYKKVRQMTRTLTHFTTLQWRLSDLNVSALFKCLPSEEDRQVFWFDIKAIDWDRYIEKYVLGAKIYALKDDPSAKSLAAGRAKLRRKQTISRISLVLFTLLFYCLFCRQPELEAALLKLLSSTIGFS